MAVPKGLQRKHWLFLSLTDTILAQDDEYAGVVVFLQMSYLNVHVSMLVCVSVCKFGKFTLCIFFHHIWRKGRGVGGGGGGGVYTTYSELLLPQTIALLINVIYATRK